MLQRNWWITLLYSHQLHKHGTKLDVLVATVITMETSELAVQLILGHVNPKLSMSHLYGCSSSYKLINLQRFHSCVISLSCEMGAVPSLLPQRTERVQEGGNCIHTRGTVRSHLRTQGAQYRIMRSHSLAQEHTIWHGLMFKVLKISNHSRRVSFIHGNYTSMYTSDAITSNHKYKISITSLKCR